MRQQFAVVMPTVYRVGLVETTAREYVFFSIFHVRWTLDARAWRVALCCSSLGNFVPYKGSTDVMHALETLRGNSDESTFRLRNSSIFNIGGGTELDSDVPKLWYISVGSSMSKVLPKVNSELLGK